MSLYDALQLLDDYVRSSELRHKYYLDQTSVIVRRVIVRSAIRRALRGIRPHKDQLPLPRINE
jgi:hypothetical protein